MRRNPNRIAIVLSNSEISQMLKIIERHEPITFWELVERTGQSARMVAYQLRQLGRAGAVKIIEPESDSGA